MTPEKELEIDKKIEEFKEDIAPQKKFSVLKIVTFSIFFLFFVAVAVYFVHEYRLGHFSDADSFEEYVSSHGALAPIILVVFQCFKVLYAVIPGAVGCIGGAKIFGVLGGFLCNYVGICAGSMLAFLLSRRYGIRIMRFIFSKKRYEKCIRWMEKHRRSYSVFLWFAIFIPISPDDFLCYFSGLTTISFRKFAVIILTAKPWTILAYSLIFGLLR